MKISVRLYRFIAGLILVLASMVFVGVVIFIILQIHGKSALYKDISETGLNMTKANVIDTFDYSTVEETQVQDDWQEGDIRYKGVHYRYNSDVLTFLFMGVDKKTIVKPVKNGIDGGQADALFLMVLDPSTYEASIVAIPRDTMTEIDIYAEDGTYKGVGTAQICLQHGYGDGAASSCERTVRAVSRMMYDLNISGYCAINMGAISIINDAVGGVEVTALEDVPKSSIKKGDTVLLKGEDAYSYLHNRDIKIPESAAGRLARQKQYLSLYAAKVADATQKDITTPITIYNSLSKYMVTDITVDEVSYLATQVTNYHFSNENIYSLPGEIVQGERFEEFYIDEQAMYELILKLYYREVN